MIFERKFSRDLEFPVIRILGRVRLLPNRVVYWGSKD
jgi:hypothetical protein